MDVVIVEDEDLAAGYLKQELLAQNEIEIKSVTCLGTVKEAIGYFQEHSPDLVFLDIHLADGNSMKILETVNLSAPIIFTTAYDTYAIEAFKHFTVDYLLKPFGREDLIKALSKLRSIEKKYSTPQNFELLKQFLTKEKVSYQKRFMVNEGHQLVSLGVNEISFFYASGKHLFIYTKKGESFLYNSTIRDVIDKLDPNYFYRVNRNYIIHIDAVSKVVKHSSLRLEVILNCKTPANERVFVSKNELKEFKEWLDK